MAAASRSSKKKSSKKAGARAATASKTTSRKKAAGTGKTASSSRKKTATASSKKVGARKATSKKATARKASTRKTPVTKASARKAASKKKPAAKKPAAKKTSSKKASSKKPVSKATRKAPARKKPASKKLRTAAPGKAGKKTVSKKKVTSAGASRPASAARSGAASKTGTHRARRKASASPETAATTRNSSHLIHGIPPYQLQAGEPYMNDRQLAHFERILLAWKRELMEEVDRTVHHMQDEAANFPDPNDRATQESEFGLELRTRDRERKLLKKIDAALERIEIGEYGYCEETGEEIGLKRLEARPVATLSVEAQERRELAERQYGERDERYR